MVTSMVILYSQCTKLRFGRGLASQRIDTETGSTVSSVHGRGY